MVKSSKTWQSGVIESFMAKTFVTCARPIIFLCHRGCFNSNFGFGHTKSAVGSKGTGKPGQSLRAPRGHFFNLTHMPMGCASSCGTFENFSSAIEWIVITKFNISGFYSILDFLTIAVPIQYCQHELESFLHLSN